MPRPDALAAVSSECRFMFPTLNTVAKSTAAGRMRKIRSGRLKKYPSAMAEGARSLMRYSSSFSASSMMMTNSGSPSPASTKIFTHSLTR